MQRIATYLYDIQGRAILTTRGTPARLATGSDGKPLTPARLVDGTGVGQVTLDFSTAGATVIANSLGQHTMYRHAIIGGEYRLLEAIGPGCSQCGQTNVRYAWRADGLLASVTRLTDDGRMPTATVFYEHDRRGRQTAEWRQAYDDRGRASGPRRLHQRFEYDGERVTPRLIASPSVVSGAEHRIAITYGDTEATSRLPSRIDESGFAPSIAGSSAGKIFRSIAYAYDQHGARIAVDGPLPNTRPHPTPADSDISLTEHDPGTGLVTRLIAPGNFVTQVVARDAALRPVLLRVTDGVTVQTIAFTRNWRGQPLTVRLDADAVAIPAASARDSFVTTAPGSQSRLFSYRYDPAGRLREIVQPGGLVTRFIHDGDGRLIRRIMSDGSSESIRTGTEGSLLLIDQERGQPRVGAVEDDRLRSYRTTFGQDPSGHLRTQVDADGAIRHAHLDLRGRVDETIDPLGISTHLDYDDEDRPLRVVAAFGTPDAAITEVQYDSAGNLAEVTDPNGVTTRRFRDDFGRTTAEVNPDRGIVLYRHDAAGRLIASIDETGITSRFRHDFAGRLIEKGIDGEPALARYRYLGMRLQDVTTVAAGSNRVEQQIRYRYDAIGQIVQTREWMARVDLTTERRQAALLPQANAAPLPGVRFDTFNQWDDAGRLVRQTLADGHVLRFDYADAGPPKMPADAVESGAALVSGSILAPATAAPLADIEGRPLDAGVVSRVVSHRLAAIRFDDVTIVGAIEQDRIAGITGYTHGNGIHRRITHDAAGRPIRLSDSLPDGRLMQEKPVATGNPSPPNAAAWFARSLQRPEILYQQTNRYDAAGRITTLQREQLDLAAGAMLTKRAEHYRYDRLNRLIRIDAGPDGVTAFSYDRGGNRLTMSDVNHSQRYRYGTGSNRLLAIADILPDTRALPAKHAGAPDLPATTSDPVGTAWLYLPTGVPMTQIDFRGSGVKASTPSGARRTIYNTAHRPIAVLDADSRPIARYYYNVFGERIAKIAYHPDPDRSNRATGVSTANQAMAGVTTYSLFRDQRLAAEADATGHIRTHYIYLDGKPVAKITMQPASGPWNRLIARVKRMFESNTPKDIDISDTDATVYAIHTDHLGTPQQVSNADRRIIWQARTAPFGAADVLSASTSKSASSHAGSPTAGQAGGSAESDSAFTMDLRLPGQVFDAETGLHYNYLRNYDPSLGRYTTPDPIGLDGGTQPYGYVGGNPLTRTDPLGLYEEDIHYYMTYFLARAAGVDARMSYVIATADQYIDDNPTTGPTQQTMLDSAWFVITHNPTQQAILSTYHFTQRAEDDVFKDADIRFEQPSNPQLTRLFTAANKARTLGGDCAYAVMYGEYLHAFEDTFAHRAYDNTPIAINSGFGHAVAGHFPDHTYNENAILGHDWKYNEARTLEMEHEVFERLTQLASKENQKHTWEEIMPLLSGPNGFNAQHENSGNTKNFSGSVYSKKIELLNTQLNRWNLQFTGVYTGDDPLDLRKNGQGAYDNARGRQNRTDFLQYETTTADHKAGDPFKQSDFPGTLLDKIKP